jgi:hypothetical protein
VGRGGASAARLTRERIWRERVADALTGRALVLAPSSVRVWLGGDAADVAAAPTKPGARPGPGKGAPAKGAPAKAAPAKPVAAKGGSHG